MAQPNFECAGCHPAETKLHLQTRMARAMVPAASSLFAQHLSKGPLHESSDGFSFWYTPQKAGLELIVRRGSESATGLIEWVLGAGVQGQTPMVRVGSTLYQSRVSYFTRLNQFGITIDQPAGNSASAMDAVGLKQSERDAKSCLLCHSSGVTKALEPEAPGVQCERCHAGAAEHAVGKGPVANPGKMPAVQQLQVCGVCHRVTPPVDGQQLENVRFQPLRLKMSRCFASGKIECTTCHAAHQDAKRNDPGSYNEKCIACHSAVSGARHHRDERKDGNCIGCHMPVVQLHPALKFTDHYIRVMSKTDAIYPFLAR
jgi:hypothetical protein